MIKLSQKGFALLGLIAVVLLTAVLGGGGYVLVSRQSNLKTENKAIEEKEELPQEKNKPTIQKTEQGTVEPTKAKGEKRPPQKNEEVAATKSTVKIFFIATDDQGQSGKPVGCGDSVVGVEKTIIATSQPPIKEALQELFSVKSQYYGQSGLYNSLSNSNLKVENVTVENSKALVNLSGNHSLAGTCDNPRFKAQIEETILQFPSIKQTSVFINNISLDKILSGEGN